MVSTPVSRSVLIAPFAALHNVSLRYDAVLVLREHSDRTRLTELMSSVQLATEQ